MFQRPHTKSPRALKKKYRFLRLPLAFDAEALLAELTASGVDWMSAERWKWHMQTSVCILRAGKEGNRPGACLVSGSGLDKPPLERLPTFREVLDEAFPERVALAWVGLTPPGTRIFLHIDNTSHWDEHHRVHVPLVTSPGARMCVDGHFVHMPAGTAWLFNNGVPHGVLNDGPARIHLVMDLPDSKAMRALLKKGEKVDGEPDPEALARLAEDPLSTLTPERRGTTPYMEDYLQQ